MARLFHKNERKRSPLRDKSLRNPGESLQEEIEKLINDRFMPFVAATILILTMAAYEWWRVFSDFPPQPFGITVIAIGFLGYTTYKFFQTRKQVRRLKLGMEGERVVGQSLEHLRSQGFHVFHDILADGFNIDHVLVGPQGIFAIETKTFSKPLKGNPKVSYDGERFLVNGRKFECNPAKQAMAERDWISNLLFEMTGRKFKVKGVVLMPGWWIEPPTDWSRIDVWVLNPKAFPTFLKREPIVLKKEDINLVCSRLTTHVRCYKNV